MVRPINNQSADESLIMSFSHDEDDLVKGRWRMMMIWRRIHGQSAVESEVMSFCDPRSVNPHHNQSD